MRIFVAQAIANQPRIDLLGGPIGLFQSKIHEGVFRITQDLAFSDAVLVPHDAKVFTKNRDYCEYLNALGKKHLILFSDRGDFPLRPSIHNSVALRVALQPRETRSNKIILPYNVVALDSLSRRNYAGIPEISFMGLVPKNTVGRVVKAFRSAPLSPIMGNGAVTRRKYLESLDRSGLSLKKVTRDSYGAIKSAQNSHLDKRQEYLEFLDNSDVVVAPRGDTNQSMRFFEVLSAGRIPLFPDTKMQLPTTTQPFPEKFMIKTGFHPKNIEANVASFWSRLNEVDYNSLQVEIRNYFVNYLEFNAFLRNLFSLERSEFLALAQPDKTRN
jgi:hypothetical protein